MLSDDFSKEEFFTKFSQIQDELKYYKYHVEASVNWVSMKDVSGNYIFVSPSCEKISGYTQEEFLKDSNLLEKIVHSNDKDIYYQNQQPRNNPVYFESVNPYRIITKKKEEKWIAQFCQPIYDTNNQLIAYRYSIRDITQEKKNEKLIQLQKSQIEIQNKILEKIIKKLSDTNDILINTTNQLRDNEDKYRSIFEVSSDAIFLIDFETKHILDVNEAATKLYGYTRDELLNLNYSTINSDPDKAHDPFVELQVFIPIHYHKKKDETIFPVEITTNSFKRNEKHLFTAAVRDITERLKAEENLRQAHQKLSELNAMKDKFFSIIAHDLKNPFNNVLGLSQFLMEDYNTIDKSFMQKYIEYIFESAQLGYNLLENLLDWSRSQTGRLIYNQRKLSLKEIVEDSVDFLLPTAKNKAIIVNQEIPDEIYVNGDQNMIMTVIRNLVSNAIKFTNQGGEITLSAEKKGREIIVSVADNGIGMSEQNIDKLFRIDKAFSSKGTANEKGTGLGLILCKEFVEKHEGKIWVESNKNKGSIFKFSLPAWKKKVES